MAAASLFIPLALMQGHSATAEDPDASHKKDPLPQPQFGTRPDAMPPEQEDDDDAVAAEVNNGKIDGRRRPGFEKKLPPRITQSNPGAVSAPPPQAFPTDSLPIPDRWRIMTSLCPAKGGESVYALFVSLREVCHSRLDPYHQNTLKGDRPLREGHKPGFLKGDDWFLQTTLTSDTVIEPRSFPIPVGVQTTERPGSNDTFGQDSSLVLAQTFIASFGLIKGNTAFAPPHVEYRLTLAANFNYVNVPEKRVLSVSPSRDSHRFDKFLGVQEAFIDYHLRDTSARFDFDSVRIGIQPFQADFRGFLFNDEQLGVRFFGNRDNNRVQYNLAAFWRLEKDTNSGLNSVLHRPRNDFIFLANLYRQDFLRPGLTGQFTVAYNRNRDGNRTEVDKNGFPVRPALLGDLRPHNYDVVYLGTNFDGRFNRINLTASAYCALGKDSNNFFTSKPAKIRSFFAASELSYDKNWMRFRLSGLYASGDGNTQDDTENGYDAINENPVFAGADTSYWIRQTIPFAGGGRAISINGRNGILNNLRSSKEQGQSNFNNPGTVLVGAGADFDLTPQLRVSGNANHLWFANTATLQALRMEGSIPKSIGWDISASAIWRPKATQNIVARLSAAALMPGAGFKDLFGNAGRNGRYYSVLANAVMSF